MPGLTSPNKALRNKDPNLGEGLTILSGREPKVFSERAAPSDEEEAAVVDAWLRLPPTVDGMKEEEVLAKSPSENAHATDLTFPASNAALYRDPSNPPSEAPLAVQWTRLDGSLYVHSARSGDVIQGGLGDCWFLGALASVASRQDLLLDLIVSDELSSHGVYTFRFYKNGQWHDIVVDDQLPCQPGFPQPLFAHSAQQGELWPSLMEKAYAKLHGTYFALDGGNVVEALVDLTGGAGMKIRLNDQKYRDEAQSGHLWERIMRYNSWGYLMGCSYANRDPTACEEDSGEGILWSHAYSILDVREISSGSRLMRIRNPWGRKEWKGAWSDGAPEWSQPENATALEELEYEFADDGTFWMTYQDFIEQYNKLYVCRLFPPSWHQLTIKGAWVGRTAGGSPVVRGRTSGTWCNNPQYRMTVNKPCEMVISLMQRDARSAFGQRLPKAERHLLMGLVVLKVGKDFHGRKWTRNDADVVKETDLVGDREITLTLTLDPAFSYLVVPYTALPEQEGPFVLRTFSSAPVEVERPPPAHEVQISGSWTVPTSGGRRFSPTFGSNPQYLLEVPRKTQIMMMLERTDTGERVGAMEPSFNAAETIGVTVCKPERTSEGKVCRRLVVQRDSDIVAESEFNDMQECVVWTTVTPETPYAIVPSSAQPGLVAPFQLCIYSSTDMTLTAFHETQTSVLTGSWTASNSGGSDLHETWTKNPRFLITVHQKGTFRISLSRPGKEWKRNTSLDQMIGFYLMRSSRNDGRMPIEKKNVVAETAFVPMNEVFEEIELTPTPYPTYVIVPCTYAPSKPGNFRISVTGEAEFSLKEV